MLLQPTCSGSPKRMQQRTKVNHIRASQCHDINLRKQIYPLIMVSLSILKPWQWDLFTICIISKLGSSTALSLLRQIGFAERTYHGKPLANANHFHHPLMMPNGESYKQKQLCRHFSRGRCYFFGDNCKFLHDLRDKGNVWNEFVVTSFHQCFGIKSSFFF